MVAEIEIATVEPGKVGTLRGAVSDLRQVLGEQDCQVTAVSIQVSGHPIEPRLPRAVRGCRRQDTQVSDAVLGHEVHR